MITLKCKQNAALFCTDEAAITESGNLVIDGMPEVHLTPPPLLYPPPLMKEDRNGDTG